MRVSLFHLGHMKAALLDVVNCGTVCEQHKEGTVGCLLFAFPLVAKLDKNIKTNSVSALKLFLV